jgi:hypothetical protein
MADIEEKFHAGMSEDELVAEAQPNPEIDYLRAQVRKRDSVIKQQRTRIGELSDISTLFESAIRALPPPVKFDFRVPEEKDVAPSMAHLCLSDWHAEETIDPEEMEGYATFNWEVFRARAWKTIVKCVELTDLFRHGQEIRELTVYGLGDMVTGDIHADGERTASMPLPLAIVELADVLAQMLNFLTAHFEVVNFVGVCGNHGRMDHKPPTKQKADRNWDTSVYHIARKILRDNKRINWVIPRSPAIVVGTLGCDFLVKHGDGIRAGGTTPYYGLARDTSRELHKRRKTKQFDYILQGHLHHFGILEGNRILCPSLIGPNQFSFNLLHSDYPAEQLMMLTSESKGLTNLIPIKLADVSESDGHGFIEDRLLFPDGNAQIGQMSVPKVDH